MICGLLFVVADAIWWWWCEEATIWCLQCSGMTASPQSRLDNFEKQDVQTLTGSYRCSEGRGVLYSEQSAQNILPQFLWKFRNYVNATDIFNPPYTAYLQWCFLLPNQNSVWHPVHLETAWSGTHRVGVPSGRAAPSSTASHDISDRNDSTADVGPSPALQTESTTELYKKITKQFGLFKVIRGTKSRQN